MAADMCMQQNCTDSTGFLYDMIIEMWSPWDAVEHLEYTPWLFSLLGSTVIGLTGIFPLLIVPIQEGADLKTGDSAGMLKMLLSFAVGGLLGDVFLHLLPEAWANDSLNKTDAGHPSMTSGLWVLGGFLVFVVAEKLFAFEQETEIEDTSINNAKLCEKANVEVEKEMENNNCINLIGSNPKNGFSKRLPNDFSKVINELQPFLEKKNGYSQLPNGFKDVHKNGFVTNGIEPVLICTELSSTLKSLPLDEANDYLKKFSRNTNGFVTELSNGCSKKDNPDKASDDQQTVAKEKPKHISGYLNLIANVIDNFTHGLAVGGSFLVSFRLGVLTTFAILIHEIPHEVGDFAILLRSGFNRWDAARAQLFTASGGIFGAMFAVLFSGGEIGEKTNWILPFTAGGFLHIGMVTILPELLKETSPKESLKQIVALLFGITLMAVLTILCD
ncbi:zinc transporter ZIP13 homolog isoform X2 [Frieseomelitta varia]|uniref:zinc transporter ZIP13 homolog isoform X2 n=1 Tax=Frieseomelitta varia TaxID=561572 RepID=UPI001CB689AC|nr:zinc transporter ZIP13 homolog isoform X2 [Frieseomelitta varia]